MSETRAQAPAEPMQAAAEASVFVRPYQHELDPIIRAVRRYNFVSGRPHVSQPEASSYLGEIELYSKRLHAISVRFEKAAATLPHWVADNVRLTDLRHAIATARGSLEQARFSLEACSKLSE